MTTTTASPHGTEEQPRPGQVMKEIGATALQLAVDTLTRKVDGLADRLGGAGADSVGRAVTEIGADLGAKEAATASAAVAGLQGRNPLWAAIKGAWSAGGAKVKTAVVAAVVALVLLLVLSPVLLLLLAITVAVVLLVAKAKQREG